MSEHAVGATLRSARLLTVSGVGHAAWGAVAYRRELAEIGRAGVAGSVGDGLFQRAYSTDGRAAAFWFMFAAPLTSLCGCLAESALRHGDHRAVTTAGRVVVGLGLVGTVVMPRSGFVAAIATGWLLLRQARDLRTRPPCLSCQSSCRPQAFIASSTPLQPRGWLRRGDLPRNP